MGGRSLAAVNRWLTERRIGCPFCGESITILIDASAGSQQYTEDCQVCCRPILVTVEADGGELDFVNVECGS